jgi:hypothetical protein
MLEVEGVLLSCIPKPQTGLGIVLCIRRLLLLESFDLRPSHQYILMCIKHELRKRV